MCKQGTESNINFYLYLQVVHADYPLIRDDLLISRGKSAAGASVRSSSIIPDDNRSIPMRYNMEPMRKFEVGIFHGEAFEGVLFFLIFLCGYMNDCTDYC